MLSCVITQFLFSGSDYWLSLWTDAEQLRASRGNSSSSNSTDYIDDPEFYNSTFPVKRDDSSAYTDWLESLDTYTGIYVFTILTAGLFIFSLIRSIHFFVMCMKSSVNLHNSMFQSLIRAPLLFFDRNPVGKFIIIYFKYKDLICSLKLHFYRSDIKPLCKRYWLYG
jgi:ATP-binding cassette subfamily C (CFTR/MRP) protein 4